MGTASFSCHPLFAGVYHGSHSMPTSEPSKDEALWGATICRKSTCTACHSQSHVKDQLKTKLLENTAPSGAGCPTVNVVQGASMAATDTAVGPSMGKGRISDALEHGLGHVTYDPHWVPFRKGQSTRLPLSESATAAVKGWRSTSADRKWR